MKEPRLQLKIFAYLLGFCTLLLAMLWVLQTVFLNDMYKFIRKRELHEAVAIVAQEINSPDLQSILLQLQVERDIMISETQYFVMPMRPKPEGRRGAMQLDTITETHEFTLENGQSVSLTFHALIVPVNATVSTLRTQLLIATAVMLLDSVMLAILIAKRVSRPIEKISRSAQSLAKGDYETRFCGKGFREISTLSDTLNAAAVELGRVEGLRRELLANVSHDLRTPIALVYSYAEMMHDFPEEISQEQIQLIMDETQRLTTLVNDVLDLSKLESDMERCNVQRYNLTQSLRKTTQAMRELLKKENYEITFNYTDETFVNADEIKIGRVFYNLLINAVNYSGESRIITITQEKLNDYVRISVSDSGDGIAQTDLPAIWDRYYKGSKAHKRAVTGTGLGLSIVRKIIELHQGRYGVTSEVGKGSTFWFELPIEA